jgi:Fe2+ transport system protein FeoA
LTLADLKRGDRARICEIDAAQPSVQRLMIMGLVEGTELECLGGSLGGDPMEFLLYGSALSLRRSDAQYFRVIPAPVTT